ncbi:hypothetical protein AB4246_20680, partial [Vibrio splendidus]
FKIISNKIRGLIMKRVIFDNHPLLSQEELEMLAMVVGGRGEEGGASRPGRIKNDRDLDRAGSRWNLRLR